MLESSEESDVEEAPEIADGENKPALNALPEKSKEQYQKAYNRFREWCGEKDIVHFTENVLVDYFSEKSKKLRPPSLWSEYSMLRSLLSLKHEIDIKKYTKLIAFLKGQSVGYQRQKSKSFTREHLHTFLNEAPDLKYLMKKVIAIFGVAGACRRDDLQRMTIDDIEDAGSILIVKIPKYGTDKERSFVVEGNIEDGPDLVDIYRKYASLRPPQTPHRRFFVYYRKGQCSVRVVGINTFSKVPCEIAKYLNLKNPELYTGHCFRRSAKMFAETGSGLANLKRGSWRFTTVTDQTLADTKATGDSQEECSTFNANTSFPLNIKEEEDDYYSATMNEESIDSSEIYRLPSAKKRRKLFSTNEDSLEQALKINQYFSKEDDACSNFSQYVASKMRIYSARTRAIVEHKISHVLFEADMGKYDNFEEKVDTSSLEHNGTF